MSAPTAADLQGAWYLLSFQAVPENTSESKIQDLLGEAPQGLILYVGDNISAQLQSSPSLGTEPTLPFGFPRFMAYSGTVRFEDSSEHGLLAHHLLQQASNPAWIGQTWTRKAILSADKQTLTLQPLEYLTVTPDQADLKIKMTLQWSRSKPHA